MTRFLLQPLDRHRGESPGLSVSQEDLARAAYFRTRRDPAFHFDGGWEVARLVEPEMRAKTIALAQDISNQTFRFRGVEARLDPVDWECCPEGNPDWTRDLNRHFYFVTLGLAYRYTNEPIYVVAFVKLFREWLVKNGPGSGAWACPFEVAARLNAWLWSFFIFREADAFTDQDLTAFLGAFRRQARHLDANLEFHVPTNHIILEGKTLALCGLVFPEWKEAERWWERGMTIMNAEIERQVCADGVHGERSTLYHKIVTSELSELMWLLYRKGQRIPQPLLQAFERMVEFDLNITKPDGTFPLFSDSAATDTYLRFSAPAIGAVVLDRPDLAAGYLGPNENTIWLLGEEGMAKYQSLASGIASLKSRGFPEGGYFIMRGNGRKSDCYLAMDCGPFGLPQAPGHGHADALTFELFAGGQSLIVDAGVYGYFLGEKWRAYFRGTEAHNTLVVDGQDQSVLDGVRHVYRSARASLHGWLPGRHFDWFDGSHDGYCRLPGRIRHRRQLIFVKDEYWIMVDWALGEGSHRYDFLFHLNPSSNPVLDGSAVKTRSGRSTDLSILPFCPWEGDVQLVQGEMNPIRGWVSFESGEVHPCPTLVYRTDGSAPAHLAVALFPFSSEEELPTLKSYTGPPAGEQAAFAGGLTFRGWTDYVVLVPDPLIAAAGPLQTDGTAAFLRWDDGEGRLTRAFLLNGSDLNYEGTQVVKACRRLDALELACGGGYLDVWAKAREECELTVLVAGPVSVRVNGQTSRYRRAGPFITFPLAPVASDSREVNDGR